MTAGTDMLKAGLIATLIDGASFGDGSLDARGVGAEDDFGSAIDVAV